MRFADGKVSLLYKHFFGYEKGDNELPKIIEKEVVKIRQIYKLFFEGKSPAAVVKYLTANEILFKRVLQ